MTAKYLGIADEFRTRILSGELVPGTRLPTDRELIRSLETSQATVTKAMGVLSHEGLIVRRRRTGTVVASPERRARPAPACTVYILGASSTDRVENPNNWFVSEQVLRGIINANNHYRMRILPPGPLASFRPDDESATALILINKVEADPGEEAIVRQYPHIHTFSQSSSFSSINAVNYDVIASTFNLISHVIRAGHRDVAMIWGGGAFHQDKLAGFRMALDTHRLPFREEWIRTVTGGREAGRRAAEDLLKHRGGFTALYADTDLKALGAMELFSERGIDVPGEISVVGTDDIPGLSEEAGITTIHKPFVEIGARAMALLHRRILAGGADVPSETLCGILRQRSSVGPPPKSAEAGSQPPPGENAAGRTAPFSGR